MVLSKMQESLYYPFGGNQTIQIYDIYGNFRDFPQYNALFDIVWVVKNDPWFVFFQQNNS